MIRFLSVSEVIELHRLALQQSCGADGVRDLGGVESAVAQCAMTFGGNELYPTLIDKAAALCYSLVMNHPFLDGNKRVGHLAMETFLVLNGVEIDGFVDEQEQLMLRLAWGELTRDYLADWLRTHVKDP